MNLQQSISKNPDVFLMLCNEHHIKRLFAFGSSVNGNFNEEKSDIDLLVEVDITDPLERGEKLLSLWEKLEAFFQRKVDLLTNASIKNPLLKANIDTTKILIYDGERQKISY